MVTRSASDVRRLAEAVNGRRDTDIIVATDRLGELVTRSALQEGDTFLFTVNTRSHQHRVGATGRISADGMQAELEECDAVFWTEASVEKFVWPYYEAHGIDVSRIRAAYEADPAIVAIAHVFPSIPIMIYAGPAGLQALTVEQYQTEQLAAR